MANADLHFEFNDGNKHLEAVFDVFAEKDTIVDTSWVKDQLIEAGFGDLAPRQDGIAILIDTLNNGEAGQGRIIVAEKQDATVSIYVPKDKMTAFLTVNPPRGGAPVTLDLVKRALAEKGVRHGFIPDAIKTAIVDGEAEELMIAAGDPVINGEDAKFICLLPEIKVRTPQVSENGNVDYRDLGEILIVHPGEQLMRRIPATAGIPSRNVFGESVNPARGKDASYAKGLDGVEVDRSDPNILVATITGQPIVAENGVRVEDKMTVKTVNLATGNINFDGSVLIEGDVENGMKVEATGDINVLGMVESAKLEAGGDIVIRGAIIGHGDVRDKKNQLNQETAILNAKGSITAKFTENAYLESGNNIFIQDWVVKSELSAYNEIIVGNKNAKKGQIIGGFVKSGILVKAINVGSGAGVLTRIQVGISDDVERELENVSRKITDHHKTLKDIQKAISKLKNNPTAQAQEKLKKVLVTQRELEDQVKAFQSQKSTLKTEQTRVENAKLSVEKTTYSGVTVSIAGCEKTITEDLGRRSFSIQEGKLTQSID